VATVAVSEKTKGANEEELAWLDEVDVVVSALEVVVPAADELVVAVMGVLEDEAAAARLLELPVVAVVDVGLSVDVVVGVSVEVVVGVSVDVGEEVGSATELVLAAPAA